MSWAGVLGLICWLGGFCEPLPAQGDRCPSILKSVGHSLQDERADVFESPHPFLHGEVAAGGQDGRDIAPRAEAGDSGLCAFDQETCGVRYPTVGLSGFLQFDAVWFGEPAAAMAAFGDIADSTAVRRARIAVSGDVVRDLGYKLDLDFAAPGHPSFRDMLVEVRERAFADRLVVGFFKVPFQLDALISSRDFTFAERAPFFTFAPFRQIGLGANGSLADGRATWSAAGFRTGTDGFAAANSDNGYGAGARSTVLPWSGEGGGPLVHLGADCALLQPNGRVIQYDSKLSFFVDEEPGGTATPIPPLVDTGLIGAAAVNLFNVELAGVFDAFHFQSEITYSLVNQIGGPPLALYGGYAQAGWFLTGESRPYDRRSGVFTTVVPRKDVVHRGPGAWEVAVQGTYLNLNDENIHGGRLNSAGVVLNWYLTGNAGLKFIWSRGFVAPPTGGNVALDIYGMRLQVVF